MTNPSFNYIFSGADTPAIVKIFEDDDRLKKFHENSYMIAEEYKEHVIESKWMQLIKNILDLNPSNLIL